MRNAIIVLVAAGVMALAGVSATSCGGGGGGGAGGGSGGGSGTGGGSATGGGSGGGTTEMADADAGVCTSTQGNCTTFEDRTAADAGRTVEFAGNSGVAEPACMRIKVGQTVSYHSGIGHPLVPLCGPVNRKLTAPDNATTNITFHVSGKYAGQCSNHLFPSVIQVDP